MSSYYILAEAPSGGVGREAYDCLDDEFGTREFRLGQALAVIGNSFGLDKADALFKDLVRSGAVTNIEEDKTSRMFVSKPSSDGSRLTNVHYAKEKPSAGKRLATGSLGVIKGVGKALGGAAKHMNKPGAIERMAIGNTEMIFGPNRKQREMRRLERMKRDRALRERE